MMSLISVCEIMDEAGQFAIVYSTENSIQSENSILSENSIQYSE